MVYRAWQPELNRWVAIKVVKITPGAASRSQFRREVAALGALSGHPNIVTVHDAGLTQERTAFIVMEYLPDGTLADQLARGPVPWPEAAVAGVKLSGALETAHRAGVLHLDVKPENVFRSADDDIVKLGDFGIATIEGNAPTTTGTISGTVLHMAPERLEGERPTIANDIYSSGSTLFALIVGHPPFGHAGEAVGVVIHRILHEPAPLTVLRSRGAPPSLCEVIGQALSHNPGDRQASAAKMGEQLRGAQADAGVAPTTMSVRDQLVLSPPPVGEAPEVSEGEDTLPPVPTPMDDGEATVPAGRRRQWSLQWTRTVVGAVVGGTAALFAIVLFLVVVPWDSGRESPAGTGSSTLATRATSADATRPPPTLSSVPRLDDAPTFVDDFSDPASGWPRERNKRSYDGNGAYRVEVHDDNNRLAAGPGDDGSNPALAALSAPHAKVRLEIDATFLGDGQGGAGLYCRMGRDDRNRYQAVVFPNGHWQITTGSGGPGSIDTLASGKTAPPPRGTTFRLTFECVGDGNPNTLRFALDGRYLGETSHAGELDGGGIGVVVATAQVAPGDVLFDNFAATSL